MGAKITKKILPGIIITLEHFFMDVYQT
jgi:hypothetical protein